MGSHALNIAVSIVNAMSPRGIIIVGNIFSYLTYIACQNYWTNLMKSFAKGRSSLAVKYIFHIHKYIYSSS